ncbi:uncharacterized protein LOC128553799 [Mercenaria mercenaria]|uniref:uncharacterized protein LOC128553799 n=1 Tax=Mercenaria mercenaria TaxID=6596 RepID=UPI00234E5BDE|nr:uncharacterized protein LOC128553799 [Mercenaria mercenaria]
MNFTAFSLTPDPIKLGSDAQVSFTAQVKEDIGTTNTLQIDVDAKLDTQGTTIDVCDYLTCHFPDFCSILKQYKSKCPGVIKKLVPQCQCPLKKNEYTVTKATIPLPSVPITVNGLVRTTVDVKESGKQMGCIEVEICIGSC